MAATLRQPELCFKYPGLILSYLIEDVALEFTLVSAIAIIAGFNYYYSIVKDEKFIRRFAEMVILSMGVALISFGIGLILRKYFGIEI